MSQEPQDAWSELEFNCNSNFSTGLTRGQKVRPAHPFSSGHAALQGRIGSFGELAAGCYPSCVAELALPGSSQREVVQLNEQIAAAMPQTEPPIMPITPMSRIMSL